LIEVLFWYSGFRVAIYLWGNHYLPLWHVPHLRVGLFWTWSFFAHFCNTCHPLFFSLRHFSFILHHLVLIVRNTFSHILICMFDEIIKKVILISYSNQKPFFIPPKIRSLNLERKQYLHEGTL
jgi:hypothetical protein